MHSDIGCLLAAITSHT